MAHPCRARRLRSLRLSPKFRSWRHALADHRAAAPGDSLTAFERRIADLAATGPTNREIAQQLYLTPKTVENPLSNVY